MTEMWTRVAHLVLHFQDMSAYQRVRVGMSALNGNVLRIDRCRTATGLATVSVELDLLAWSERLTLSIAAVKGQTATIEHAAHMLLCAGPPGRVTRE